MIELNMAETLWICSYLNNKERLQFGSTHKGLYKLLQPLFESIAEEAKCRKSEEDFFKIRICICGQCRNKNSEQKTPEYQFAKQWKEYNEDQLTNHYYPYLINYNQAKIRVTEKLNIEKICSQLGVATVEEAIRIAVEKNTVTTSQFELLCRHVKDINQKDADGNTILHLALKHNREMFVYTLLKVGVNCNRANFNGETPLHFAAILDTDNMVGALLKNNARLHAKDHEGKTALDWAKCHKKKYCFVFLKKKYDQAKKQIPEKKLETSSIEKGPSTNCNHKMFIFIQRNI